MKTIITLLCLSITVNFTHAQNFVDVTNSVNINVDYGQGSFGVGNETLIGNIKVKWLSGLVTSIFNVDVNQRITIVENSAPLAIDILDFKLDSTEENAFNLTWSLAGNLDEHRVILQKSTTGLDFEDLLLVNEETTYRDWEVKQDLTYYYRLKIIDNTNQVQYSDILNAILKGSSSISNVSIFPNPSERYLKLQMNSVSKGTIQYQILDSTGRIIKQFNSDLEIGINDFQIDLESLIPSNYYLQLEFNGEVVLRPFTRI